MSLVVHVAGNINPEQYFYTAYKTVGRQGGDFLPVVHDIFRTPLAVSSLPAIRAVTGVFDRVGIFYVTIDFGFKDLPLEGEGDKKQ